MILLALSTLGLAIALGLPGRIWQSFAAFLNLNFDSAATITTPFDNLKSPNPLFPLIMLLLWLTSAFILITTNRQSSILLVPRSSFLVPRSSFLVPLLLLFLLLFLAWGQRAAQLLPDGAGRFPQPNYDEMVYYAGSAIFGAGQPPYREFFTAHPPGVYLVFAGLFKVLGLTGGGANTFLAGRWFSLVQGLLTVVGIFWAAGRLWAGKERFFAGGAAAIAALVYALDGRAAEIAVLENLSNLFAIAGFSCFLEAERAQAKRGRFWLMAAGGLAAAAALTKLPGLALLFALLVYLCFQRDWRRIGWLSIGFGVGALLIEGPFVLMAGPGEVLRQQIFFQMLRPQEVREGIDQIARIAAYPEASLTVFLAGLGLISLAWQVARKPGPEVARLLLPVLWSVPLLIIFIFSKSYHNWYYVQWALPLALIAGGIWSVFDGGARPAYRWGAVILLVLVALPFGLNEWHLERKVEYDRVYGPSADFVRAEQARAEQNKLDMFALDPGYPLMAALSPARLPNGKFLIDPSSYLLYLNLEMDRRGTGQLLGEALGMNRDRGKLTELFSRERAQSLILLGLKPGSWVVLDGKIALQGQLTPRSVEYVQAVSGPATAIDYANLYKIRSVSTLREWRFDNGLLVTPFGLSSSLAGQANYDQPLADGTLRLSAKDAGSRTLDLRLVWRVERAPSQQLKVFVHLIDQRGQLVAQRDVPPVSETTDTRRWLTGDAFQDVQSLPLPSGLTAGRYQVVMGIYAVDGGQRVLVEGQDSITLGSIEII